MDKVVELSVKTAIRAGGVLDNLCTCDESSDTLPTFSQEDLAGFGLRFDVNQNQKDKTGKTGS